MVPIVHRLHQLWYMQKRVGKDHGHYIDKVLLVYLRLYLNYLVRLFRSRHRHRISKIISIVRIITINIRSEPQIALRITANPQSLLYLDNLPLYLETKSVSRIHLLLDTTPQARILGPTRNVCLQSTI